MWRQNDKYDVWRKSNDHAASQVQKLRKYEMNILLAELPATHWVTSFHSFVHILSGGQMSLLLDELDKTIFLSRHLSVYGRYE